MRIKHYIKNFLIFLPLIFGGLLFNWGSFISTTIGFISFSLLASTIYIVNDIKDREKDRLHSLKKHRPIAAGKISVKQGFIFASILFVISMLLNYFIVNNDVVIIGYGLLIIYALMNVGYSFGLKNVPLIDIAILVFGFLIRLLYGSILITIPVSNWLYLTVIAASFYLVLSKRRVELSGSGSKSRAVLNYYTKEYLDKNMYMFLGITIVFYSLWCVDPVNIVKTSNWLIWTVPIVIIILMKYSLNLEKEQLRDPVEIVYEDPWLISLIIVYIMAMIGVVYVF